MKKLIAFIFLIAMTSQAEAGIKAVSTSPTLSGNYAARQDSALMPHFRKCLSNVKTGSGGCRILIMGDSTTMGWGSSAGSDVKSFSWPAQVAKRLQAAYPSARVSWDSFMGDSSTQYNHSYDPRFTAFSGAWTDYAGGFFIGGLPFENTGSAGTLSYKPISNWDTAKIWYLTNSGNGTFGYQIDSGSTSTQSTSTTTGIGSVTATTGTPGNHQLNLTYSSGAAFFILGVEFSDSTHPGISFINAGSYGSTSGNWTSIPVSVSAWSAMSAVTALAPDGCVIDLDLNDYVNSITVGQYTTNIQTMITTCQAQSDTIIVTSNHGTGGSYQDSAILPYIQAVQQLAASNNIPLIDNWSRQVSYAFQNTNSWMYDSVHLNAQGYGDFAEGISDFFVTNLITSPGAGLLQAALQDSKSTAVNNVTIGASATGASPTISVQGSDTNVGIQVNTQGTGVINLNAPVTFPSARTGTFVCTAGGSITVSNTNVVATSNIILTLNAAGGTVAPVTVKSKSAATNFIALCGASDTSTYNYVILN